MTASHHNSNNERLIVDMQRRSCACRRKSRSINKAIHVAATTTRPVTLLLALLALSACYNRNNATAFTTPIIPFSSSSSRWTVVSSKNTRATRPSTTRLYYTSNYMHYQILGVTKYSTKADIKRAFRQLAKQYHPDANPDQDTTEKFQQINEAYAALRENHRRHHHHDQDSSATNSEHFSDTSDTEWSNKYKSSYHSGHSYQNQNADRYSGQYYQTSDTYTSEGPSWKNVDRHEYGERNAGERSKTYYSTQTRYTTTNAKVANDFDWEQVAKQQQRQWRRTSSSSSSTAAASSNHHTKNGKNKNNRKKSKKYNDNDKRAQKYWSSTEHRASYSINVDDVDWDQVGSVNNSETKNSQDTHNDSRKTHQSAGDTVGTSTSDNKTQNHARTVYDVSNDQHEQYGLFSGEDITKELDIDFMTGIAGGQKTFHIDHYETCGKCSGRGTMVNPKKTTIKTVTHHCTWCRGSGFVPSSSFSPIGGGGGREHTGQGTTCPVCNGAGTQQHDVIDNREPCKCCEGQGREIKQKTIKVHVPRGVDDGDKLVIPGEGHAGPNNGPPGTLYLKLRVNMIHHHETSNGAVVTSFCRVGSFIYSELVIDAVHAKSGCSRKHDVIELIGKDGNGAMNVKIATTKIKIPPNTKSGHVICLEGKGAPLEPKSCKRGDHLVSIRVVEDNLNNDNGETEDKADDNDVKNSHDNAIARASSSSPSHEDKEDSSKIFVVHEEDSPPIFIVEDEVEDNSSALFVVHEEQELVSFDDQDAEDDKYAALTEEEEMLMNSLEDQLLELKRKKLINQMKLKKIQGQHDKDGVGIGDFLMDDEDFYFLEDSPTSMNSNNGHNDTIAETYLRP